MRIEIYTIDLGTSIAEHFYDKNVVDSDEIWERLHEALADLEFTIYDEVERQLKQKNIRVEYL